MYSIREKSPYAGMTVKTKTDVGIDAMTSINLGSKDFTVEDWWENVYGRSWLCSDGNFAALGYALRLAGKSVPIDNEVLYGKIGVYGFLFHISELELPEVS